MAYDKTQLTKDELKHLQHNQRTHTQLKIAFGKNAIMLEESMAAVRILQGEMAEYIAELDKKYKDLDKEKRQEAMSQEEKDKVAEMNKAQMEITMNLGNLKMQECEYADNLKSLKADNVKLEKRLLKKYGHDKVFDLKKGKVYTQEEAAAIAEQNNPEAVQAEQQPEPELIIEE